MKRLAIILVVAFAITPSAAKADITDIDGHQWKEMSGLSKNSFLIGFISGSDFVAYDNIDQMSEDMPSEVADVIMEAGQRKAIKFRNDRLRKYRILNIKVGQLSEGLDKFYSDYRNYRIKIQQAIYIVVREIRGASPEEISAITEKLRSYPDGVLGGTRINYIDKFGQKQSSEFPY